MTTKPILDQTHVQALLDKAQHEAETNGFAVTIAVADDGGHLLGLRRLDGAGPFSAEVASAKARTAAISRKETQVFEDMINAGRSAMLSAPFQGLMTGGVPVIIDGQVAGSVGVSGVKPEQDRQVALAALDALASRATTYPT